MKKLVFIKNAAILTVSSLLLRLLGVFFRVRLAAMIGAEGIGLYQMIFSFYVLASAFATSGLCTAVTRLIAEETALGSKNGVCRIFRRSILLTLLVAIISAAALFFGSDFCANFLLGDSRAAPALRIMAISLPFLGVISCFRGYFLARRNATPNAVSQIAEQLVRIILVLLLVAKFRHRGLAFLCGAVLLGDVAAGVVSTCFLWVSYRRDRKNLDLLTGRRRPPFGIVRKITHIALPITAGRYLSGGLRTAENLLVPRKLPGASALAQFGWIKGMALPLLLFPAGLLGTLSTLLIPEISEAAARGNRGILRETTQRVLQLTALVSFLFSALFAAAGRALGAALYGSPEVGELLCKLAPLVPLMYLDSVSDGILKGLDQQKFSFRVGVADSLSRLILIFPILPRYGLSGFLAIMYFSNILTCSLNVGRVLRLCDLHPRWARTVFLPLAAAVAVGLFSNAVLRPFPLSAWVYIIIVLCLSVSAYTGLLFGFGCLSRSEIKELIRR